MALAQVGWQLSDQLDRGMAERHAEIVALAHSELLRSLDDPRLVRDALQTLQRKMPLCAWVGVVDPSGRVLAATGGLLEGMDVSTRPWFKAALNGVVRLSVHFGAPAADFLLRDKHLQNVVRQPSGGLSVATQVIECVEVLALRRTKMHRKSDNPVMAVLAHGASEAAAVGAGQPWCVTISAAPLCSWMAAAAAWRARQRRERSAWARRPRQLRW